MGDPSDRDEQPPDDWPNVANWPLRYAAESFVSYGLFDESEPTAHAWLAGTVLRSERRRVEQTGQGVILARVRTTGFEADICMRSHSRASSPGRAT